MPRFFTLPKLAALRDKRLLSQQELADRVGMSRTTISNLEHGGNARASTLRKLAAALEVEPEELIDDTRERDS